MHHSSQHRWVLRSRRDVIRRTTGYKHECCGVGRRSVAGQERQQLLLAHAVLARVLRRAGAEVVVMSVEDDRNEVVCSRGVRLVADKNVKELAGRGAPADWDLIAVPGGMPGAEHIADHVKFHAVLEKHFRAGKLMAALCKRDMKTRCLQSSQRLPVTMASSP